MSSEASCIHAWWYVVPRLEEWKASWVQWDILQHWQRGRKEFYLGYNEDGYILIKIFKGQVTASGPAVSFSGVVA